MKTLMKETSTQKIYWDDENAIVWGIMLSAHETLETAKKNIEAQEYIRDELKKEKTRVLIDMREVKSIASAARDYFANERTAAVQRATALLVDSVFTRVIANFFMGLNKPRSETKMFTDEKKAIAWLKEFSEL